MFQSKKFYETKIIKKKKEERRIHGRGNIEEYEKFSKQKRVL